MVQYPNTQGSCVQPFEKGITIMYKNDCKHFEVDGYRDEDGNLEPTGMVFCDKEDPTFKGFDCEGCLSFGIPEVAKTATTVDTDDDFPF